MVYPQLALWAISISARYAGSFTCESKTFRTNFKRLLLRKSFAIPRIAITGRLYALKKSLRETTARERVEAIRVLKIFG